MTDPVIAKLDAIQRQLDAIARPAPQLLSKRAAARYLGVDRGSTLEGLISRGHVRTVKVGGRVRIPLAELQRVAQPTTQPHAPTRPKARAQTSAVAERILALRRKGF